MDLIHTVRIEFNPEINLVYVGLDPKYTLFQDDFTAIDDQYGVSDPEINQYFYHPDHLGSSSFITDANGDVDQHLQYLPFGEPWIDQRTSNNIRFTFSGKERDEETGYNYFGARYYNADISIWLSVDPLSDKFPSMTDYNYCFNNPIKLIDPNGMEPTGPGDPNNEFGDNMYIGNVVDITAGQEVKAPIPFLNSDEPYHTTEDRSMMFSATSKLSTSMDNTNIQNSVFDWAEYTGGSKSKSGQKAGNPIYGTASKDYFEMPKAEHVGEGIGSFGLYDISKSLLDYYIGNLLALWVNDNSNVTQGVHLRGDSVILYYPDSYFKDTVPMVRPYYVGGGFGGTNGRPASPSDMSRWKSNNAAKEYFNK